MQVLVAQTRPNLYPPLASGKHRKLNVCPHPLIKDVLLLASRRKCVVIGYLGSKKGIKSCKRHDALSLFRVKFFSLPEYQWCTAIKTKFGSVVTYGHMGLFADNCVCYTCNTHPDTHTHGTQTSSCRPLRHTAATCAQPCTCTGAHADAYNKQTRKDGKVFLNMQMLTQAEHV